jgi:hypothetical protein
MTPEEQAALSDKISAAADEIACVEADDLQRVAEVLRELRDICKEWLDQWGYPIH